MSPDFSHGLAQCSAWVARASACGSSRNEPSSALNLQPGEMIDDLRPSSSGLGAEDERGHWGPEKSLL